MNKYTHERCDYIYLQTSMNADILRVRIEGLVVIRMALTTACANQVSLAEIAKWVGLSYTCFYFFQVGKTNAMIWLTIWCKCVHI